MNIKHRHRGTYGHYFWWDLQSRVYTTLHCIGRSSSCAALHRRRYLGEFTTAAAVVEGGRRRCRRRRLMLSLFRVCSVSAAARATSTVCRLVDHTTTSERVRRRKRERNTHPNRCLPPARALGSEREWELGGGGGG